MADVKLQFSEHVEFIVQCSEIVTFRSINEPFLNWVILGVDRHSTFLLLVALLLSFFF